MRTLRWVWVVNMLVASDMAAAEDVWVLVRSHSGQCSVQQPTERPLLGTEIARAESKAAACSELLSRYESANADDPQKCGNFTVNVRALCANAGVKLPNPTQ